MASVIGNKLMSGIMDETVDREKKCPLLLRVFINNSGRHYHLSEYSRGTVPSKEVQIYTWMDCTLKELASLVKEVNNDSRRIGTRFDFALVFPDMRTPMYRIREIGTTINGRKEPTDQKTLAQARFQIGDYIDVAISIPNESTSRPTMDRGYRGGDHFGSGGGGGNSRLSGSGRDSGGGRFNGDHHREHDRRDRGRPY